MENNSTGSGRTSPVAVARMRMTILMIFSVGTLFISSAGAQSISLSGRVSNEQGAALEGVSVREKGTGSGTVTNAQGAFHLEVSRPEATLVFSSLGFREKELTLSGQPSVQVTMVAGVKSLGDVVVVAYGTQRKGTLTSAQVSVTGADFKGQPVTRLDQALQGRASGVQVTNATGAPGGDVRIRIRGANSVTGNNDPLYVIDGFVGGDFKTVNPDDIAGIEVLKDAAATAPYGSRGSNGVIIVTTKKGRRGPAQLSLTARLSSSKVIKTYDKLDAADYAETVNAHNASLGVDPYFTDEEIQAFRSSGGTDWQRAIYQTALGKEYSMNIDGGTDKTTYYLSGSYQDMQGVIRKSSFKAYSLRSNINAQLTNKLSAYVHFNGFIRRNINTFLNTGQANPVVQAIAWSPTVPLHDANGYHQLVRSDPLGSVGFNPMAEVNERLARTDNYNVNVNGGLRYDIVPGLALNVQYDVGYLTSEYDNFGDLNVSPEGGYAGRNTGTTLSWQNTNTLDYKHVFNGVHHLGVTAVFEMQKSTWTGFNASINQLIYPSFTWNNLGLGTAQQPGSGTWASAIVSLFGRVSYTYKDKWLFSGTIRRDASSVFRGDNKAGYFPSLSLGWALAKEKAIERLNLFDLLNLRASWGLTGNQAVGAYSTFSTYSSVSATYSNSTHVPGIVIDRSGNPDLKWETTEQKDIGIDMQFSALDLHVSADFFRKDTRDLLFSVGLPMYTGGKSIEKNIGEVRNQGWEISVGGTPLHSEHFSWSTSVNYSAVRNKVIKLTGEGDLFYDPNIGWGMTSSPEFVLRTGQPMGAFWGLKYLGTWKPQDKDEAAAYGAVPGDSRYADLNGDHAIDTKDFMIIGYGLPRYTAGWNNTFSYRGLELNVFLQGVFGFEKLNYLYGAAMSSAGDFRQAMLTDVKDRYIPGENEHSDIPAFSTTNHTYIQSSRFVDKADFVRIKNVSLSYILPKALFRDIASIKLFAGVTNLYTITGYDGMDPESTNNGTGGDAGQSIDYGAYPIPRTFTAGLTLNF